MKSKELMQGCRKDYYENGFWICGEKGRLTLCPICKAKQSERLNCYKEELKFLEVKMFDFMNINGTCFRIMSERINFLKQEIKDLEEKKENMGEIVNKEFWMQIMNKEEDLLEKN